MSIIQTGLYLIYSDIVIQYNFKYFFKEERAHASYKVLTNSINQFRSSF